MASTNRLVVLITGTTEGGLGHALATAINQRLPSASIWCTARQPDSVGSSLPSNCKALACDVTDQGSVTKAVQHVIQQDGRIDVLINSKQTLGTLAAVCETACSWDEAAATLDAPRQG